MLVLLTVLDSITRCGLLNFRHRSTSHVVQSICV
jgi:hypothetical protein